MKKLGTILEGYNGSYPEMDEYVWDIIDSFHDKRVYECYVEFNGEVIALLDGAKPLGTEADEAGLTVYTKPEGKHDYILIPHYILFKKYMNRVKHGELSFKKGNIVFNITFK